MAVEGGVGELDGDFEAAADSATGKEFADKAADIVGQRLERVGSGIDGPDDDVKRIDDAAGFVRDKLKALFGFFEGGRSAGADIGEEADFGDAGAEFVVEVAGEAGTFGFDEALGLDAF